MRSRGVPPPDSLSETGTESSRRDHTKAVVFAALALGLVACAPNPASATPIPDLAYADIHFEVPQRDLIPNVAAMRASCNLNASGEPLSVFANGSVRSSLAVSPGPCAIIVVLGGVDVALPVFNTTPIGRSSFYLPGISTITLGFVDLSVDLVTSMNSTSRVETGIADVSPRDITWSSWGAERIVVHAEDALGAVVTSLLNTTFTYRMSLSLTVYLLSIELYRMDLAEIGSFVGSPSLRTDLSVDLRPHALALAPAEGIRHDQATMTWSGLVETDLDHLELWLSDGTNNVVVHLAPAAVRADVLIRPATEYRAWIVAVDSSGQGNPSNEITFTSPAAPGASGSDPLEGLGSSAFGWMMVVVAALLGIAGYVAGSLRGRKSR